jgi:hypothetical protein
MALSASGRLVAIPPGAMIKALRAQIRIVNRQAANTLARHLSGEITRRVRRMIGTNHPDAGEPKIERAHGERMKARQSRPSFTPPCPKKLTTDRRRHRRDR